MGHEPASIEQANATFGDLLRALRRAAGLTQEELAERAGLSARGIADLERGARRAPRRETVALLVRALALGPSSEAAAALDAAARRGHILNSAPPVRSPPAPPAPPAALEPPRHNLPAQTTALLGRDEAVRAVVALLRRADVRLVTMTGPGGAGKTRLAIESGVELVDDFADGAWFVRLSRLTDPSLTLATIAQTLSLKESGSQPIAETLRAYLASKRLLLILDNFEHLAAAAPAIADLLESSPALKVLTTSRAPLRLRGEREYPVPPLLTPPTASPDFAAAPERLAEYPATALFIERARAVQPAFAPTATSAPAIAAICARLDGLPLAIELAAARVKLLPPTALLTQLERGLGLLAGGARDLPERQQTMGATLAWSERLLTSAEQTLFRRLAVFAGGATLEAAEAVCATPEAAEPLEGDLLDGLGALVDQHLALQRDEGGAPRFGMLRVVREYALARLEVSGEAGALRQAHGTCFLALAERARPELTGPSATLWLDRLEREHDNLRAALGWARERGDAVLGLRLAASMYRFWVARGYMGEGRAWLEKLLALGSEQTASALAGTGSDNAGAGHKGVDEARARALSAGAWLTIWQGDSATAVAWAEEAVALARAVGAPEVAASATNALGLVATMQGDSAQAAARFAEGLALMREAGHPAGIAIGLLYVGYEAFYQGDLEQATATHEEALAIFQQLGDQEHIAVSLGYLGAVARRRGELAHALTLQRQALALFWELGDLRCCAEGLEHFVCTAVAARAGERAARLLGAAAHLRATLGAPLPAAERLDIEQAVADARAALGDERWAATFAAGQALTLEEAIAEALGDQAPGAPPSTPLPPGEGNA